VISGQTLIIKIYIYIYIYIYIERERERERENHDYQQGMNLDLLHVKYMVQSKVESDFFISDRSRHGLSNTW
jgi:hypothetical protein